VPGIEVIITYCSFNTSKSYKYKDGSNTRLINSYQGVYITFNHVNASNFKVNGVNCFRVGEEPDESTFSRTELSLFDILFTNLTMINANAFVEVKNALVTLENSTFTTVGQGEKPFLHAYVFFCVYVCLCFYLFICLLSWLCIFNIKKILLELIYVHQSSYGGVHLVILYLKIGVPLLILDLWI
jgi:hypothetical protein